MRPVGAAINSDVVAVAMEDFWRRGLGETVMRCGDGCGEVSARRRRESNFYGQGTRWVCV